MDITLIVKASNQQFDDQTIKCEPSWTIRRLKGHLTEVYPGKPSTDEQKLIYSGQLLSDSVVLKDVLRHYDGQQAHTVHLVFTPKNNRHQKDTGSSSGKPIAANSSTSMSPKPASERNATTAANSRASNESTRADAHGATTAGTGSCNYGPEGIRQRHTGHTQQHSTGAVAGIPAATVAASPITPVSAEFLLSQQLAVHNWMQQTYMEYLNQYMNVISNGQANTQSMFPSASTNFTMSPITQTNTPAAVPSVGAASVNPILSQTLPNLAYYPYLSTMNSSPMPSASSIPAPISSSGTISGSSAPPPAGPVPSGPSSQPTFPNAGVSSSVPGPAPSTSPSTDGSLTGPSTSAQASSSTATSTTDGTIQNQGNAGTPAAAPAAAGPAAGAAAAPARRFPNIVVEEQENRDWLDIFFSLCRVGILMTVVYLYSSPTRCLTVLIIGIMLYLYQMGFFRNNNAERIERARRIVVQQINNAHGARMNAAAHVRVPEVAPEVARGEPAAVSNPTPTPAEDSSNNQTASNIKASSSDDQSDGAKINSTSTDESAANTSTEVKTEHGNNKTTEKEPTGIEGEQLTSESTTEEQPDQSNAAQEANRVNINDVAAFLRTLVLSFFTSIIPDTPAA